MQSTGANLTGTNLADADLSGAVLAEVKGMEAVQGLDKARNRDKALISVGK